MATPSNKSIVKAIDLIELMCGAATGLSLRAAAEASGLSLPTTHRILSTLKGAGAISAGEDGTYTLGPRLLALHRQMLETERTVQEMLETHMMDLLTQPAMSARLSVLDGGEIYIFAGVDNGVAPAMRSRVGARYEAYCTAPGKVLLASLSLRRRDDYIFGAGFVALTPNTIIVPSQLEGEIRRVHAAGYALDNGEFLNNVRCLAVPVRLSGGHTVAALSIASQSLKLAEVPRLVTTLTASASHVSHKLCDIPGALRALQNRTSGSLA